jgi:chromosome condensin MukBEF MukE localization factor
MTVLSCFRVVNGGDTTGAEDVDDDAFLFDFSGWTSGSAHMWYDNTSNAADGFFKIRLPTGATAYIPYSDSTTWA